MGYRKEALIKTVVCVTVLYALSAILSSPTELLFRSSHRPRKKLGVFDDIFVIHLPHRHERWDEMETLRSGMGAEWDYVDGVLHKDMLVSRILQRVRWVRSSAAESSPEPEHLKQVNGGVHTGRHGLVAPPQYLIQELFDADAQSVSTNFGLAGSDLWELDASDHRSAEYAEPLGPIAEENEDLMLVGGVTAQYLDDHTTVDSIKTSRWLSRSMVACWLSHLRALRQAAVNPDGNVLLLEDDVDMEWDLQDILENEWSHLPADWDMVFLGV